MWLQAALAHSHLAAFDRLEQRALSTIAEAMTIGALVVSTSWGKDSIVASHLAWRANSRRPIALVHLASSYALPGSEAVRAYWTKRATVVEVAPGRDLDATIAWLQSAGLGYERTQTKQAHRAKSDRATETCRAHGWSVQVLGMRADESNARRIRLRRSGLLYQRACGLWTCAPLAWWSARDVWAYIARYSLPYLSVYDCETHGYTRETLRNGGWLTTLDAPQGRLVWLRHHYPAQWRRLVEAFPHASAES